MCNPVLILTATAAAGGMQAYGQYQQGIASQKYYNHIAEQAKAEGDLAYARSEKQSNLIQDAASFEGRQQKTQAAQVASSQRAALVANGIDLSSVTAEELASETMDKSRLDELAIRYNADIRSWSTREEGKYNRWAGQVSYAQNRAAGKQAKKAGMIRAGTTLLSTAASMALTAGLLAPPAPAGTNTSTGPISYYPRR